MAKKELTIKVNGTENVEKLADNLDKVDIKIKSASLSASDLISTYKDNLQEVIEHIVLEMSKISAIITELNTYTGKLIDKNVEEGEKLAENIEKSSESSISSIKIKAIEASTVIEAWIKKVGGKTEDQSTKLDGQLEKNKELIGKSLDDIAKIYTEKQKEIGIINLKGHKENVNAHIDELKNFKTELEAATLHTELQYNIMCMHYDKDSEEFKKAQNEKTVALKSLQDKIQEVDKSIEESNKSYLEVWKTQHGEIQKEMNQKAENIETKISKNTKGVTDFISKYDEVKKKIDESFKNLETKEIQTNNKKYEKKIEKLDKELEKVRAEAIEKEKEKAQLEKEQAEAKKKAEKYKADIERIKQSFEIKESETDTENVGDNANLEVKAETSIQSLSSDLVTENNLDEKNGISAATEAEMQAAQDRIAELERFAEEEENIVKDKQCKIEEANNAITVSNRSVLLEQMRIEDEKTKLQEEKAKKEAEIAEKAKKRKEKLEKLEKIKAKAQLVLDIAKSTSDIAKGVANAWGLGPIIGPPMAALVAINGALQLKTMTEQLKYMQDGGLLSGKRHSQGGMRINGTNIEVEGGEYVVNRETTGKNLGLIRYINSQRKELTPMDINNYFSKPFPVFNLPFRKEFEQGGQMPPINHVTSIDNEALIDAIKSIKIAPKVAVTDIIRAQDEAVTVDRWSGV
ncbi:MAG: hypothetical protein E6767_13970 [Dysgonomonas sp.]|nr:hypothetical protein [Dysgonomonas sp.]